MAQGRGAVGRVKTGIGELDRMVGGGIPVGSKVLLCGGPGTGKTIFGLQFLWNGATKFNEKGMYISFEMELKDLEKQAKSFGWDFSTQKQVKFCKYSLQGQLHVDVMADVMKHIRQFKPQRLVFDSLTAYIDFTLPRMMKHPEFANAGADVATRYKVNSVVEDFSSLRDMTTLFIDESTGTKRQVSGFIADTILSLHYRSVGEMHARYAVVDKMRYSDHAKESLPMTIESGKGIVIKAPLVEE